MALLQASLSSPGTVGTGLPRGGVRRMPRGSDGARLLGTRGQDLPIAARCRPGYQQGRRTSPKRGGKAFGNTGICAFNFL